MEPDSCGIVSAKWMNKTDILITGGTDSTLRFWDLKRGDPEVHNIFLNDSSVSSISLTDGKNYNLLYIYINIYLFIYLFICLFICLFI